jgi:hypothetical protein
VDERSEEGTIRLTVSEDELDLIRNALRMLENTYGREEADQLEAVQQLLARLGP